MHSDPSADTPPEHLVTATQFLSDAERIAPATGTRPKKRKG